MGDGGVPGGHVEALLGGLLFQGRGVCHALAHGGGAEIREETQVLSDGKEGGLRPLLGGFVAAPFRAAHSAEEDGVTALAGLCRAGGIADAHSVSGAAAHQDVHEGKLMAELVSRRLHDLPRIRAILYSLIGYTSVCQSECVYFILFVREKQALSGRSPLDG